MAQPKGSPPLPPFEQWSFKERRYIQWLVDMHNAHYNLEAALADATVVAATEHYGELPPCTEQHHPLLLCLGVRQDDMHHCLLRSFLTVAFTKIRLVCHPGSSLIRSALTSEPLIFMREASMRIHWQWAY